MAFGLVLILVRFLELQDVNVLSSLSSTENLAEVSNTTDSIKILNHTIEGRNKEVFRGTNGVVNEYNLAHNTYRVIPKNATNTVSISQMNELLLQSHSNTKSKDALDVFNV